MQSLFSSILLLKGDESAYYNVRTIHLSNDVTVETVKNELEAYQGKGAFLFNLHKVGNGADSTQMTFSPKKLEKILEFIHDNEDKFQVVTYSELFINGCSTGT